MWNRVLQAFGRKLSEKSIRRGRTVWPRVVELEDRAVPATFFVTNTNDFGPGSLRQAVLNANVDATADDIQFTGAGAAGTITLFGQMTITNPVTISGPGASALTVSGGNASRIFQVSTGTGVPVTISGLTLTGGVALPGNSGGAINSNYANLTVTDSVVTGNVASYRAGGIFAGYGGSTLTLRNSTVSGNTATSYGGAIYSRSYVGTVIENCTISGNRVTGGNGGGVYLYSSPLQVRASAISGNASPSSGGGMYINSSTTALFERSTISANRSDGSVGGGLRVYNTTTEIRDSTVSGNSAASAGGGLYFLFSTATVRNSTIAHNIAYSSVAGGIYTNSVTIAVESTIVANNRAPASPTSDDMYNAGLLNASHSLFRVTPGGNGFNGTNDSNLIADPQLGPLQDNGGPTLTHAIPSTSPAVDAGINTVGLTTDQRGVGFDRSENGIPDIGAVEWDTALVTNTDDTGSGSLRAAVAAANNVPDLTPIRFAAGVTGTITLTTGDVILTQPVDIVGPGPAALTVAGDAGNRFLVSGGGSPAASISGLTLVNPAGFFFDYPFITTGDLAIDAGATGNIVVTGPLELTDGTLALTDNNGADLGPITLLAGGALSASGGVILSSGDTLAGSGALTGNVSVQSGGTISPGPGTGSITVNGNLELKGGTAAFSAQLNGAGPGQYDRLIVNGAVDLGTGTNFVPSFGFSPPAGTVFTLIANDGIDPPAGKLNGIIGGGTMIIGGVLFQVHFDGGDGNDVTLAANTAPVVNPAVTVNLNPIPEDAIPSVNPGTSVGALLGAGGLYSDAQGTLRPGLAVTALDGSNGLWQYTVNGGAIWTDFGFVSPTFATLLQADGAGQTRIRFLPNADYFGDATISFRAWDGMQGPGNGATGVDATLTSPNGVFGTQTATATISVLPVNDPPVAVNDTAALLEDAGAQTIGVVANDSTEPGESLTVSSVTQGAHGTVAIAAGGTAVNYTPDPDYAGPDTFLYFISDGQGGSAFAAVSVTVANDAADRLEVVTSPGIVTFTEGGGAVVVDPGLRVGSALEGVLNSATVRFASGYVKGKDKLLFTPIPGNPVKGTFNTTTGMLTLTGSASPAAYQAALRSVTYNNASPLPVDGMRTLAFQVKDVAGTGDPATRLLRVVGVNTKPTATLTGATISYTRGRPGVAVAGTLLLKDLDNTRLQSARVAITGGFAASQDVLTVTTKPGISASYDSLTGVLTLTGNATLATYQAVLRTLKFSTPATAPANPRTLSLTVNDGQLDSDALLRTVNVV